MPNYTGHINKWKERANIDFFTEFVKGWIPFNAWMSKNYDIHTERGIIEEIKKNSAIKTKVKHLLENTDEESNNFKNYLAMFHNALEELELKNNERAVNFTNIIIQENKKTIEEFKKYGCKYRAQFDNSIKEFIAIIEDSKGRVIFNETQTKYNYEEFCNNISTKSFSEIQKKFIKSAYKNINPWLPENLILKSTDENNFIKIGNYNFCNDTDKIFKAIMENIYALRCLLFHGDIEPTDETNNLFESAYFILKYMLKAIN